ncbi:Protein CBG18106 [Caenorhabditis briggsae]|uniref:Protein CBG18106 n=1 Tax=Caenorhabditis briggsae TaxID=6238 RepID=A8XT17_CAEBR|nr:Protein CBG18106 [Caenorhabditis briggsae]CAP35620.1 Protein CBG18106 [Caenorhabditis briggsae]
MKKLTRDTQEPLLPHIRPLTKNKIRKYLYAAIFIIAIYLLSRSLNNNNIIQTGIGRNGDFIEFQPNVLAPVVEPVVNNVKLDIYMEAQCPDTSRFFRQQLKKAWDLLGRLNRIELNVIPFGKARCTERGNDFECQCQHGPTECEINQLMNCVIDRYGFPHIYLPAVLCMQGKYSLDEAMKCVTEHFPVEYNRMRECASGPRGRRLLALSGQKTASLTPAIDFIPWIVINGARNSDALYDLTQNTCEAMQPIPQVCREYLSSIQK